MRESAETKARRYLTEGRLIVTVVAGDHVTATCRGDGEIHRLEVHGDDRQCSCLARSRCSHLIALGLVTATHRTREDHR